MDQEKNFLIPKAVSGIEITEDNKSKMRIGEGVAGQVITDEQSIYIPDIQNDERYINLSANINYRSMIVAPVSSGSQKLGTISIQSRKTHAFSRNDISLLMNLVNRLPLPLKMPAFMLPSSRSWQSVFMQKQHYAAAKSAIGVYPKTSLP